MIRQEIQRRLREIQDSNPTKKRKEVLEKEITRHQKSIEKLLDAYQEGLLELDELRIRLPHLRKRSEALRSEFRSLEAADVDRETFLRLANRIENFLDRLRCNSEVLDVVDRQKILRLVVKEVLVYKETIKVKHSIPIGWNVPSQCLGGRISQVIFCVRGVISPLLANLYLHILDRIWERRHLQARLGARIVRYADDIVILCRKGKSGEAMAMLRQVLEGLELTLNVGKTKVVDAYAGKFDFLGFTAWMGRSIKTGKYYPHVQPSKKAEQKVKDRITELTKRDRTIMPLEWVVNETNTMLRGWVGYFHYRNCSQTLIKVRNHLEQRMITHLRKRHKVRNRNTGYVRFPNRSLYKKYGLYKVPTSAGWTKAHALR